MSRYTFERKRITVKTSNGDVVLVADVHGSWGIHYEPGEHEGDPPYASLAITFVPDGRAAVRGIETKREAEAIVEESFDRLPAIIHETSLDVVLHTGTVFRKVKNERGRAAYLAAQRKRPKKTKG